MIAVGETCVGPVKTAIFCDVVADCVVVRSTVVAKNYKFNLNAVIWVQSAIVDLSGLVDQWKEVLLTW